MLLEEREDLLNGMVDSGGGRVSAQCQGRRGLHPSAGHNTVKAKDLGVVSDNIKQKQFRGLDALPSWMKERREM